MYARVMSKTEILAELPHLSAEDRNEILEQLWRIEEDAGPTAPEKTLLDEAQASYESNPEAGSTWVEVEARLRQRS